LHAIADRPLAGASDPYLISLDIHADADAGAVREETGRSLSTERFKKALL
jgi:hypothetical protein